MQFYNMFTCEGFDLGFMSGCSMAWLGGVVLFFIAALCRKYLGEKMDIPFDFIFSLIGAFLVYFIVIGFTGSFKWALGAGLIGLCAGGFGAPYVTGNTGE